MRTLVLVGVSFFAGPLLAQADPSSCRAKYQKELESNKESSLLHFRFAECLLQEKDRVAAVNELRAALNGDLEPGWIEVWARLNLGKIFDITGQRERALGEYRLAEQTGDNTRGALDEAAKYLKKPYDGK